MKNLNVTITDDADRELDKIMEIKHFKNRADAVDWLIREVFKHLNKVKSIKEGGR